MKIINLIEDTTKSNYLIAEHGLSFYVETPNHKLLIDTGASDLTWKNADNLNINLNLIDSVFLTHGHYDHCGGVLGFVAKNKFAKIYINENAKYDYYNIKSGFEKYIGINKKILDLNQLILINSDINIDDEIFIFTGIRDRINWPVSNLTLRQKINDELLQDEFLHEQYIVIKSENKLILFSGCAHNGIIKILNKFHEIFSRYPDAVFSGFHMNKNIEFTSEDIEVIKNTAQKLSCMNTEFYTGHCTGLPAFEILSKYMSNLHPIYSGFSCFL